jgi:hypothetical protein
LIIDVQYGTKLMTAHTASAAAFLLHHAKIGRLAKEHLTKFGICSGAVTTNFLYSELPLNVQGEDVILFVELS